MEAIKVTARQSAYARDQGRSSRRWALGSLALSMLLSSIGVSIPNVALPTLAREFGATFSQVQWVILVYLLAVTVLIVIAGRFGDALGRRRVLMAGLALSMLGALIGALSNALWTLLLARAIQGLGAAISMALSMAIVSETVSKEKTGSAMGLMGTMSAVGTAAGPSLGGILISQFGWRSIFVLMAVLGVLTLYLSFRFLPDPKTQLRSNLKRMDGLGFILMIISLSFYALSMTLAKGSLNWISVALFLGAVITAVLFVRAEVKAELPLVRIELFRNVEFSGNIAMNLVVSTVMMSTLVVGPFYLSKALGLSEAHVGMVMSVGPIMSMLSGLPAGRIVDRWGPVNSAVIGLSEMLIGVTALAFLPSLVGLIGYIIAAAILSPGYQLFQAANNTSVMTNVASSERGAISGILSLSRNLGLITGASMMGAVFSLASKSVNITVASSQSIARGAQVTFFVAGLLILIALFVAIRIRKGSMKIQD